jgi:hypothetical protein
MTQVPAGELFNLEVGKATAYCGVYTPMTGRIGIGF